MLLIRVNNHVTNMPLIKPALLKFKKDYKELKGLSLV